MALGHACSDSLNQVIADLTVALCLIPFFIILKHDLIPVVRYADCIFPGHIDFVHGVVTDLMEMRDILACFLEEGGHGICIFFNCKTVSSVCDVLRGA